MHILFQTFKSRSIIFKRDLIVRYFKGIRNQEHVKAMSLAKETSEEIPLRKVKIFETNNFYKLTVIGSGAKGSSRCVELIVGRTHYLFNCGEGMQRLAFEYKRKLTRLNDVFITYPSWDNISGLIGMALSLESSGSKKLSIYGPDEIERLFSATHKFINLRKLKVTKQPCHPNEEFSDTNVNIKYVYLYPSPNAKIKENALDVTSTPQNKEISSKEESEIYLDDFKDDVDYYEHLYSEKKHEKKTKVIEKMQNKENKNQQKLYNYNKTPNEKFSVSFICRARKILGSLNITNCAKLGVPVGPLLGRLKKGEDITLEDGTIVKSSQVKDPDTPGPIVIVVECPSELYLDSLLNETAFLKHQSDENPEDKATLIVHFSSSLMVQNPRYIEWINRFPKETKHLFINEDNNCLGSINVNRLQMKLNMLHPDIFPLLPDHGIPDFPKDNEDVQSGHKAVKPFKKAGVDQIKPATDEDKEENCKSDEEKEENMKADEDDQKILEFSYYKCDSSTYIKARTMCQINLQPKVNFDYSNCLVLKKDLFKKEVLLNENFIEEFKKFQGELKQMEPLLQSCQRKYPKVLFLGTGSSQPSKTRNSSGILIFLDDKKTMLLDCGEGTYGQLVRFFGKEKTSTLLQNLSAIYISHLHVDHHLGLITLLRQRKESISQNLEKKKIESSTGTEVNPLYICAPLQITKWLNLYNSQFETISDIYELIPNLSLSNTDRPADLCNKLEFLNLEDLRTTAVDHCPNSFGVAITHNDGWKLTYSGDTRPCENLVKLGQNSDILIHEATLDHTLAHEAVRKLHSTTCEAINVGKKMNAKYIILTHFSQRYCYVPLINEAFSDNVGFAFDNMMVSYDQLPVLPKLKNSIKALFLDYHEKLEETAITKRKKYAVKRRASKSPEVVRKKLFAM